MIRVEQWCRSPIGTNWIKWAVDTYTYIPGYIKQTRTLQPVYAHKKSPGD